MSYTIKYSDGDADDRRSMIDAISYLGMRRYKILARLWKEGKMHPDVITMASKFAGIQGRPVESMRRRYETKKDS